METERVEIISSTGQPLGRGKVVHWGQTTIRTRAGGSADGKSWPNEYGQAPAVVIDTGREFKVVPLADEWGQATVRKIAREAL